MDWWNIYSKIIVIVVVLIGLVIWVSLSNPFSFNPEQITTLQLLLAVISTIAVIFTLMYSTIQFRKATAKPKLKILFDENDNKESTTKVITTPKQGTNQQPVDVVIINKGDAVASTFQVDLITPIIYNAQKPDFYQISYKDHVSVSNTDKDKKRIISICNNGLPFFVNRLVKLVNFKFNLTSGDLKQYSNEFEIQYKVYGSWAETQEGKLQIKCV